MKIWVALGVVFLAAGSAIAQQQEDPVDRALQHLKDQLSLTDEQVTKINEIRDAVRQEMRTFFQNRGRGGNQQDLAAQWTAFQEKSKEETTKKIVALLTDEQKPKFEEA